MARTERWPCTGRLPAAEATTTEKRSPALDTTGASDSPAATLVIGLGNVLRGDDGVGVRVAQALAARTLPQDVQVIDGGTQGLGIVNLVEGRQRVILVDAANVGAAPGQFVRFALDEARLLGQEQHLSVHASGLRDALLLAKALKVLPEEIIIFGVQPANLEWGSTLSSEVDETLPSLITAVLAEIADCQQPTGSSDQPSDDGPR